MGNIAVRHVQRIHSYADALNKYETTSPIRGRTPEFRPLARRRDADMYSIRMREDKAVECRVYRTPVVTFLPDNSIEIRTNGFNTDTTHGFIGHITQYKVEAKGWTGKTQITVSNGVYLMEHDEVLHLRKNEQGSYILMPEQQQRRVKLAIDRKGSNKVRARYKEFTDYLDNFLKLRTEKWLDDQPAYLPVRQVEGVRLQARELASVLGLVPDGDDGRHQRLGVCFYYVGEVSGNAWHKREIARYRPAQEKMLLSLIDPGQPEEIKMENYYKAALALCAGSRRLVFKKDDTPETVQGEMTANAEYVMEWFKKGLLMANAKEVLKERVLEPTESPSRTYQGWIINEGEVK